MYVLFNDSAGLSRSKDPTIAIPGPPAATVANEMDPQPCMIDHRTQQSCFLAGLGGAMLRPHVHDLGRGIEQVITQLDRDCRNGSRNT